MSFLGFDLLDGSPSMAGFLSTNFSHYNDDDAQDIVTGPTNDMANDVHQPPIVFATPDDESNWILDGVSLENDEEDGITIVSSAPTLAGAQDDSISWNIPQQQQQQQQQPGILAMSPHVVLSTDHALSIYTTDSLFTTMMNQSAVSSAASSRSSSSSFSHSMSSSLVSSRSVLSLNPSSLPSSVMTSMSLLSNNSRHYHHPTTTLFRSALEGTQQQQQQEPAAPMDTVPPTTATAIVPTTTNRPQHQHWYASLATDNDWQTFRQRALELLTAVGGDNDDRWTADELLALLIQQEEEELWAATDTCRGNNSRAGGEQGSGWKRFLCELALMVAATAAMPILVGPVVRRRFLSSG